MTRLALHLRKLCVLAIVLLLMGCFLAGHPGAAVVKYHVAVIADEDRGASSEQCDPKATEPLTYRYPSGRKVTVRVSKDPILVVPLDEAVSVMLVDYRSAKNPGLQVVVAEVIPSAASLKKAHDVRRSIVRCDVLIKLNDEMVGISRRGIDWSQHLPGGTFSSTEAAERAFSRTGASIQHEMASAAVVNAQDEFWEWRKQKDLWDFHCDATIRETIRSKDPKLFEALRQTPTADCQNPPVMPGTLEPN